jgi:hypothetical protein
MERDGPRNGLLEELLLQQKGLLSWLLSINIRS